MGGALVMDPGSLVSAAASALPGLLADSEVTVAADPECFFSIGEDGSAEAKLFCGPVAVFAGSGPWAVVGVDVSAAEPTLSGLLELGVAGPRGRALLSAEGDPPAAAGLLRPPPVRPGTLVLLEDEPPSVVRTSRSGLEMVSPVYANDFSVAVRVVSLAEVESFGSGYFEVRAPEGHRLLVVELEVRDGVGGSDLRLGGVTLGSVSRFVVAPVPLGEALPDLQFESRGSSQGISLEDGSRSGDFRLLWYESPRVEFVSDGPVSVSFGLPEVSIPNELRRVSFTVDVVAEVEVEQPVLSGPSRRPAPEGKVWVPVRVDALPVSSGSSFVPVALVVEGAYLDPESGEEAPMLLDRTGDSVRLYALVPESLPDLEVRVDLYVDWSTRTFAETASGTVYAGSVRAAASFG